MTDVTDVSSDQIVASRVDERQDPHRSRMVRTGLGLSVLGVLAIWVGLETLSSLSAWPRSVFTLAGVAAVYSGIDRLIRARHPRAQTDLVVAIAWLTLVILVAAFADLLPLGEHEDTAATLREPGYLRPDLFSSHPFGTNNFGLDILARAIYGARVSLVVGFGAVVLGTIVGGLIGLIAGFFRKTTDAVVGVFTDALLAVPALVILVALASVVDRSLRNTVLALALLTIPTNIRLARANTMRYSQREFVQAARGLGATRRRIMMREVLPNIVLPMLSYAFVIVAVLIVAEASISFLGLGLAPPKPTWGNMIAEGDAGVFEAHPHIVLVPGVVMFLTVFSLNRIGEWARVILDPNG